MEVEGVRATDRWQNRVRTLRRKAKGWSANVEVEIKRKKKQLSLQHEKLDVISETRVLNGQEERMRQVVDDLNKIWEMGEVKARQRARERDVKGG
jgi:hypothetical protein